MAQRWYRSDVGDADGDDSDAMAAGRIMLGATSATPKNNPILRPSGSKPFSLNTRCNKNEHIDFNFFVADLILLLLVIGNQMVMLSRALWGHAMSHSLYFSANHIAGNVAMCSVRFSSISDTSQHHIYA